MKITSQRLVNSALIAGITCLTLLSTINNAFAGTGNAELDQELYRTNELIRQAPHYQRQAEQASEKSQGDLNRLRMACNSGNRNACSQYGYRVRAQERYRLYLQQKQLNFYRNRKVQ
jgi:hypothetical protein